MDKIKKLLFKQQKSLLSENNTKELEKFKNFWLKNYNRAGIFDTPKQNFEDLFQVKPNGRILFGGVVVLDDLKKLIKELSTYYVSKNMAVGILATDETYSSYVGHVIKSLGSRFNLSVVARNLFRLLREVDSQGVDVILAESVSTEGLGLAVMNRLRKASCYRIIKAS